MCTQLTTKQQNIKIKISKITREKMNPLLELEISTHFYQKWTESKGRKSIRT